MAVVTVPKILREKFGEDGADALVEFLSIATADPETNLRVMPAILRRILGLDAAAAMAAFVAEVEQSKLG